jgi:hypothetical protein
MPRKIQLKTTAGKRTHRPVKQPPKPGRRSLAHGLIAGAWRDRHGRRISFNRIGMELQELANDRVGFQADRVRVRANEGTAENARRPARHVVAFQPFQQRNADLRLFRDGG